MPIIDFVRQCDVSRSIRARQVEALFDVPPQAKASLKWSGDVPLHERDWNVGLIVGPSGCGKSSVAQELFKDAFQPPLEWKGKSVIDDVAKTCSVEDIANAFSSVGFSTIPAWLRPYSVLSNGEKFRVDVARRLLELPDPIVVDEFTSVVDRQVAQVGSNAIQKIVRKNKRKFVAVSCHYDIIEWLQPDWVLEPATMQFAWRSLRRRPALNIEVSRVEHSLWQLFAPFHYLTADLSNAAACFGLFVDGRPAAFAGVIHFPHPKVRDIKRLSRLVTLPDWQGLGLAFVLTDMLADAYRAMGYRFRTYPAHPALVRSFQRSDKWKQVKEAGEFLAGRGSKYAKAESQHRPCATFEWRQKATMTASEANELLQLPQRD